MLARRKAGGHASWHTHRPCRLPPMACRLPPLTARLTVELPLLKSSSQSEAVPSSSLMVILLDVCSSLMSTALPELAGAVAGWAAGAAAGVGAAAAGGSSDA